jgi:hypothetical protein
MQEKSPKTKTKENSSATDGLIKGEITLYSPAEFDLEIAKAAPVIPTIKGEYQPTGKLVRPPSQPGRKGKLTRRLLENVKNAVLAGSFDEVVCDLVGVSRNTWYKWMRLGHEIAQDFENLAEDWEFDEEESSERKLAMQQLNRDISDLIYYDFYRTVTESRAVAEIRLSTIVANASAKNPALALEYQKTRNPQRWARQKIEITDNRGPDPNAPAKLLTAIPEVRRNAQVDAIVARALARQQAAQSSVETVTVTSSTTSVSYTSTSVNPQEPEPQSIIDITPG